MAVNQFVARYGINSLSDVQITGSLNVLQGITGSLFGTASFASQVLSASYASTASFAFAFPDQGYTFTQSPGATTWTITHGLNTLTPLVNVYNSGYNQLIPASITSTNVNVTTITFSTAQAGYAIISKGSGIVSQTVASASYAATATSASYAQTASYFSGSISSAVSASYAVSSSYAVTASYASTVGFNFQQVTPSTTWTITHNLNNQYPLVQIYDTNNLVFIPQSITGTSNNVTTVTFSNAVAGYARVV